MLCNERDIERLNKIFSHPSIWPFIIDDLTPEDAKDGLVNYYMSVGIILSPDKYSAYVFEPQNNVMYKVHANVLPEGRNEFTASKAIMVVDWIFSNTDCHKIVAYVSDIFPNVCKFTEKCGFKQEGVLTKSLLKNGILNDQIVFGLNKEDFYHG